MGFTTAAVVQEQRGDVIQITTGCKELDNILEGVWCLHEEGSHDSFPSRTLGTLTGAHTRVQLTAVPSLHFWTCVTLICTVQVDLRRAP